MDKRTDSGCLPVLMLDIAVALILWVALIILKAAGVVGMHWALVLSGLVWISWGLFAITALLALILRQIAKLKRRHRLRGIDRRIVKQAKAAGVWDKPQALGGRALDIYAWEMCGLLRQTGEKDKELRSRCMAAGLKRKRHRRRHENG